MTEIAAPATENQYPWRVGRKVGRTIYLQLGPEPSDADPLIGMMDSPEIAEHTVFVHNSTVRCPAITIEQGDRVTWYCARPANHPPDDHGWTNPKSNADLMFVAEHVARAADRDDGGIQMPQRFTAGQTPVPLSDRLHEHLVQLLIDTPELCDLLSSLVDDSECSFDHHGGCQVHGYLSLEQGEMCPNEEAKRLVEEAHG